MKKSYILRASLLAGALLVMSSCKEETYNLIDPTAVPQASDYNIKIDVDPETNQFTLSIQDHNGQTPKGVYPIWKVYTKANPVISTRPIYYDAIKNAGDYDVEMQVGNKNGISDGVKTGVIHIENTLVDFTPYIKNLTDDNTKTWQIAANEQGHLGCGPSGTEGLEWWSAVPYDKKDWGVYENRMIFGNNGGNGTGLYTFDPGQSGTIYINKEITDLPPYSDYNPNSDPNAPDAADYCAPADVQETTFAITSEGNDFFLEFPQGTFLGYLPNMDAYNNPKFKIYSITKNRIELSIDNGGIAWHYILQPEGADAGDRPFEGFKYDSEFNLWKDADIQLASTWFDDGSWSGSITQPEVEVTSQIIRLHTPANMGKDQWQGQVHINTGIVIEASKTYDFSMYLNAPVDCEITVKPHPEGDDNTFFVADKQHFDAGGSYYYFSDVEGFDTNNLVLTLDFAGYPDTDFEITKIVLKDHANDDGTVLPDNNDPEEPGVEENVTWVDVDSDANLFNGCSYTLSYYYAPGWNQLPDPEAEVNGNSFTITLPEATTDQWQAQFQIHTDIVTSADKSYDFRVTFYSTSDFNGATYKVTQEDNDDIYFMADRNPLTGYEEMTFSWVNISGVELNPVKIAMDFAGNPANTTLTIKDIIIQEHQDGVPSNPTANWTDVNSDDNLFKGCNYSMSYYYAPGWSQLADPEAEVDGNSFTLYFPTATTDQWQSQFQLHTDIVTSADKSYDFRVTFYSDQDFFGATYKVTQEDNDDIYFMADRNALEAYEELTFEWVNVSGVELNPVKIAMDFAGHPDNTTVVIKDIIIQEHR